MKKTQYSFLAISIALASQVHAAGFQVVEHSASGLGRAFSGAGAVGDNASEMSANAASMMLFDKKQFSGALSWIEPEIDVETQGAPSIPGMSSSADDVAPSHLVPAIYYVNPINDKWAWGVGMYTDYGVSTDYPDDFLAGSSAGYTSLTTFKLNPNIAYRINEQFSIGAGFDIVYAQAELKRTKGAAVLPSTMGGAGLPGNPTDTLIKMEGDTFGYGWNIGALYELNKNNRFSVSYKSAVKLKFEDGDFTDGVGIINGGGTTDADLDIELPDIAIISGFHQLNNQWAVHYSWQWTNYSKFSELTAKGSSCAAPTNPYGSGTCFSKQEKYEDNQRWSIGTTYQPTDSVILRAGFAYDEQAGQATLSIPDTDRYWYTAGMTYLWTEDLSLDAGFAYIDGKSGSFEESGLTFDSSGPAYIGSVQLNYAF
ncbi:outer membrane protein transport protein [Vibrio rumoiensis]|uniref:Long-chain fatty acid transporter n=1 Tax=Vibrio rumoiensis 1S-45 TaxID=1188252 RepID=A0A1E5E3Z5_9VIBR|nr:outer membrane protein transport protein [Vibrio rumoiensis]OEF27289.1 long-chain fatty acid transporter [Vibrio rumoiensis 1S-45]